ncbi:transglutaminase domain-containing protein [Fulvitalea axinellae]|uniref:transglutaminase domain-containing protein n=1 Tax=Fulvitalea axinellae TaxID=1182444 RepID=UPI0030CA4F48
MRGIAKKVPKAISGDPKKLAKYLTEKEGSEAQRALNIYTWIIHNIRHGRDKRLGKKPEQDLASRVLAYRKTDSSGYAELFKSLCRHAGLEVRNIEGYMKSDDFYDDGMELSSMDHIWSAVRIDGTWRLVDTYSGSGAYITKAGDLRTAIKKLFGKRVIRSKMVFVQNPQLNYFCADPEKLIRSHFPANRYWQMLRYPVSRVSFQNGEEYKDMPDAFQPLEILDATELFRYGLMTEKQLAKRTMDLMEEDPWDFGYMCRVQAMRATDNYTYSQMPEVLLSQVEEVVSNYKKALKYANKHKARVSAVYRRSSSKLNRKLKNGYSARTRDLKNFADRRIRTYKTALNREKKKRGLGKPKAGENLEMPGYKPRKIRNPKPQTVRDSLRSVVYSALDSAQKFNKLSQIALEDYLREYRNLYNEVYPEFSRSIDSLNIKVERHLLLMEANVRLGRLWEAMDEMDTLYAKEKRVFDAITALRRDMKVHSNKVRYWYRKSLSVCQKGRNVLHEAFPETAEFDKASELYRELSIHTLKSKQRINHLDSYIKQDKQTYLEWAGALLPRFVRQASFMVSGKSLAKELAEVKGKYLENRKAHQLKRMEILRGIIRIQKREVEKRIPGLRKATTYIVN